MSEHLRGDFIEMSIVYETRASLDGAGSRPRKSRGTTKSPWCLAQDWWYSNRYREAHWSSSKERLV